MSRQARERLAKGLYLLKSPQMISSSALAMQSTLEDSEVVLESDEGKIRGLPFDEPAEHRVPYSHQFLVYL